MLFPENILAAIGQTETDAARRATALTRSLAALARETARVAAGFRALIENQRAWLNARTAAADSGVEQQQYAVLAELERRRQEQWLSDYQDRRAGLLAMDALHREVMRRREEEIGRWLGGLQTVQDTFGFGLRAAVRMVGENIAEGMVEGTADWESGLKSLLKTLIAVSLELAVQLALYRAIAAAMAAASLSTAGAAGAAAGGVSGAVGAIAQVFGAFHEGGYVPRMHAGGLRPDERLIKAQAGEFVMSRRAVRAVGAEELGVINRTGRLPGGEQLTVNVHTTGAVDERRLADLVIAELQRRRRRNKEIP